MPQDENDNPFADVELYAAPTAAPTAPAIPTEVSQDKGQDQIPPSGTITPKVPPGAPRGPDGSLIAKAGKVPSHFIDPGTGSVVEIASKDRTFLRHYFELGQAGAEQNAKISSVRANHLLKLPAIQQYLREVMWKAGISDEKIALRISEGLDATTQKEFMTKDGEVMSGEEKPDFEQRGKYIDRALRVQGIDKPEPVSPLGPAGGVMPHSGLLVGLSPKDILTLVDALKEDAEKKGATDTTADPIPPSTPNADQK